MSGIHILYFGPAADDAGRAEETVPMPSPATLAALREDLIARHPRLAARREHLRFAVNRAYADGDPALSDGDEVAVIPPVAGGAPEGAARLVRAPIDLGAMIDGARSDEDGAVATFTGVVRAEAGVDPLAALEYSAYEEMAALEIGRIRTEALARFAVTEIVVTHRLGRLAIGEASVAIVVAAPHRVAAFDACRFVIDELKEKAPIWKKVIRAGGGASWVEGMRP